tara:strand:+ start:1077 stop:1709 length:633 start_codon:yes stop_codon:yes gene_type:complete
MRIPKNMTEDEVLEIIDKISGRLAYKFRFGYHGIDDIKQQGTLFAIEGMDKYDESRPLENFLWTHVRNRLFNYKRDNFERPDRPCFTCPFYDPDNKCSTSSCTEFEDKAECTLLSGWLKRNSAKKNLMSPINMHEINDEKEERMKKSHDFLGSLTRDEIIGVIDREISVEYRIDFNRLKYDLKLPKSRRNKLIDVIFEILRENGIDEEAW